jgi:hypothetical protein
MASGRKGRFKLTLLRIAFVALWASLFVIAIVGLSGIFDPSHAGSGQSVVSRWLLGLIIDLEGIFR